MPDDAPIPENSNSHPSTDGAGPDAEPRQEGPAEPVQDRRLTPRRKKLLRVQVMDALEGGLPSPGWVVDRSLGGMCLEMDREVELGTTLKVRRYEDGNAPWVELRVQSVRPFEGAWHLGCQFLRSPSWEVLMQFG